MKPIRVALLDHTSKLGGGEIALFNSVTRLDRRRYDPLVILFSQGPLADKLRLEGVSVLVVPLSCRIGDARKDSLGLKTLFRFGDILRAMWFVCRLWRLLLKNDIDIVHTNSLKADMLGGIAGRLAGLPVIWHVRDRIESDYLPEPVTKLFRMAARWLPSKIIANSAATLETLKLTRQTDGTTIYSGTDVGERAQVVHDGASSRSDLATSRPAAPRSPVIALIGRISPWKGQHVFVHAAAIVQKRFPGAQFHIVGSSLFGEAEYETRIRRLVKALGLCESIQFLGFREDIPEVICGSYMLVHASTLGEPFGQVIIEAMAAGKPVVATRGGGVPEIVVDGVTGLLVPMGDAASMAEAIARLLEDTGLADRMGAAGRSRVQKHFTIQQTVEKIEAVYNSLLSRSKVGVEEHDPSTAEYIATT